MDQYLNFRDMIDGGGAGAAGREFQGGGLLSLLANAFATPLGSDQMQRPPSRPDDPRQRFTPPIQAPRPVQQPAPQQSPLEMFGGQPPAPYAMPPTAINPETQSILRDIDAAIMGGPQYSGRGPVGMPMPQFAQTPNQQQVVEYLRSVGLLNY